MNQALENTDKLMPHPAPVSAPVAVSDATLTLFQDSLSTNTRRAYASALRRLDAWLDGSPLTDGQLADYLGHLAPPTPLFPPRSFAPALPGKPRPPVH